LGGVGEQKHLNIWGKMVGNICKKFVRNFAVSNSGFKLAEQEKGEKKKEGAYILQEKTPFEQADGTAFLWAINPPLRKKGPPPVEMVGAWGGIGDTDQRA